MLPFPQSNQATKIGKNDRWVVNYLTFAACLFVFGYFATHFLSGRGINSDYYTEGIVVFLAMILFLKALAVPTVRFAHAERGLLLMALMLVVSLVNILVSWNQLESALRWLLWFGMVGCLSRVSANTDGTWIEVIIRRLPFLFFLIYISIITMTRFLDAEGAYTAFHLSGLYGNLILATGLFANKSWQRMMWSGVGLIGIYYSGAGGALFCIPIMFIPFILYSTSSMPAKGLMVAFVLMIGALFFFESELFSSFLNIKAGAGSVGGFSYSGLDRLERSKDMRLELIQYGLNLVKENPMGTGLGHTYYEDMSRGAGVSHAHNGTISMLIELGVPGFMMALCLMLWMFLGILRNKSVDSSVRAFYFTYFFTIFGRSLSENYTPLDLGNYFNYVFLIFSGYLFLNDRVRRQPVAGPRFAPTRMMVRPGLRPPLPRPMGVR